MTLTPNILALDFDGVICNGLREYFQTSWQVYCQIWSPSNTTPPPDLAPSFYRTRPVVETGWEMPVLLAAILDGISEDEIFSDWSNIHPQIILKYNLIPKEIGATVDRVRDESIAKDLEQWLNLQEFYPGISTRLNQLINDQVEIRIITTKEGRFVRALLTKSQIILPDNWVIGKECQKPKHQTLRELLVGREDQVIWFVEDRLNTLLSVQDQPDLTNVKLYLADWGYNTESERDSVKNYPNIQLLSLDQFNNN